MSAHTSRPLSVVIYAKDRARLARFYAAAFGLTMEREEQGSVLLGSNDLEVAIVQVTMAIANGINVAAPPEPRAATPIKVSFLVADIESLRPAIERSGGVLKPPDAAWSWSGASHLDGWDPEGNV